MTMFSITTNKNIRNETTKRNLELSLPLFQEKNILYSFEHFEFRKNIACVPFEGKFFFISFQKRAKKYLKVTANTTVLCGDEIVLIEGCLTIFKH